MTHDSCQVLGILVREDEEIGERLYTRPPDQARRAGRQDMPVLASILPESCDSASICRHSCANLALQFNTRPLKVDGQGGSVMVPGELGHHPGDLIGSLAGLDTRARRDVISELIEQVTPEPTGRRGKYRMRIVWTPVGDALRRLGNAVRKDGGD